MSVFNDWAKMVEEFHVATNQPVATNCSKEFRELRGRLIKEEAKELDAAFNEDDLVETADGVIDCIYVAIGTAVACGFGDKLGELFEAVHRSNMSKLDPVTGKALYREDGKIIKGPNFKPPTKDIKAILEEPVNQQRSDEPAMCACFEQLVDPILNPNRVARQICHYHYFHDGLGSTKGKACERCDGIGAYQEHTKNCTDTHHGQDCPQIVICEDCQGTGKEIA